MADRPIIFTAESVRAIIAGSKTQTRRVVKHQANGKLVPLDPGTRMLPREDWGLRDPGPRYHLFHRPVLESEADGRGVLPSGNFGLPCPYGEPGDLLWVREGFSAHGNHGEPSTISDAVFVVLRDGGQVYHDGTVFPALPQYAEGAFDGCKWRSPLHMPRWASRLTLEVLSIRTERVQSITEEDARAEGMPWDDGAPDAHGLRTKLQVYAAKEFRHAWDALNRKRAPWASNPWVWCVSFRVVTDG